MLAIVHKLVFQFDLWVPNRVLWMTNLHIPSLFTFKLSTLSKNHTINKESWIIATIYIVKLQGKPLCINYSSVDSLNFRLALHPLVNIFSKKYCYNSLYLLKTTSVNTEDRYKDVHKLFIVKGAVKGGRKRRLRNMHFQRLPNKTCWY